MAEQLYIGTFRRLCATGGLLFSLLALPAQALETVSLQLKWTHAFQFAGYYAAAERGYYREAGLDVDIREGAPGVDIIGDVVSGRAQFGVGTSSLLLAREGGQPVVALAVIFQHSPLVLLTRQERATQGIHDLLGKRVMVEPQSDEIFAYLEREGIARARIDQVEHSFAPRDLIDGKVDAMTAYVTNEPFLLDQAQVAWHAYTPRSVGIDFYGDNLFTSEAELKAHPERARAFRAASLRGWQYALAHPEEVADLIRRRYSPRHPREFYLFEARQMVPLIRPDLIEVGYMNPGRWRHIADTYAELGMLPMDFPLHGFLYEAAPQQDMTHLYAMLAAALAFAAAVSGIAFAFYRVNRRLHDSLARNRQVEDALRVSEERHRLLADNASDVIWTMDLDGRFTYVSPSVAKLRGHSVEEAMRQSLAEALTPASAAVARQELERMLAAVRKGAPVPEFRGELEQPCKDGSTVWTEVTATGMRNAAGGFIGILGVSRDISERKQAEARITQLAHYDALTGLPNRVLFSDRLRQALTLGQRNGTRLALMFLDLDNFKPVNDTWGHAVGDALLAEAAARIGAAIRASDTVGRIGGDEFVVLLPEVHGATEAVGVAEKIREVLCRPFTVDGRALTVSASIGIALSPEHGGEAIELSRHADSAMYRAKDGGRNRIELYRPEAGAASGGRPEPAAAEGGG